MRMPRCRRTSSGAAAVAAGVVERRRHSIEEDDQPRSKMEKRDVSQDRFISSKLSPEKKEALEQFRDRLTGTVPQDRLQDHFLLQWLTARNFCVDKAEAMFKRSEEWRADLDIDHILEWQPPAVLVQYSPLGCVGFDKYGGTVFIVPHGRADTRGLLQSASQMDNIRYTVQNLEKSKIRMAEESKRRGFPICQQTCIFDLDGFSFKDFTYKPALDFIINLMQVYEANYPELLRVAYVINAPKIFTMAFALLKPFLHEATVSKIQIHGTSGWQELLLSDVDATVLPKHWGGTRVDDDGNEFCESLVCMGGKVPQSFYLRNRVLDPSKGYTTVTVGKAATHTVNIAVAKPQTVLRWEFLTDDYDIGYSIELEGSQDPPLRPLKRVSSHIDPQLGDLLCPSPGTYVVTFDNSFSYMRSKKLHYSIKTSPPT